MQNDCEIYVDPEEDEVFFGCVNEREKNLCNELVKCAGSSPKNEYKLNKILDERNVVSVKENIENIPNNEQSAKISKGIFVNDSTDLIIAYNDLNNSLERDQNTSRILSNNPSVELEHNYSNSMKQKIDKNILATPKSIVKADKDGGFLKVLSEIALVKAEVEGDNTETMNENEDKENKIIYPIPEIKITEATPDKEIVLSPPKSIKAVLRKFRNICNSPLNENNADYESKFDKTFESEKNFKNKCLDWDTDKVSLDDDKRKSVDLIDLNDSESGVLNVSILLDEEETEPHPKKVVDDDDDDDIIILQDQKYNCEILMPSESLKSLVNEKTDANLELPTKTKFHTSDSPLKASNRSNNLRFSKDAKKIIEVLKELAVDDTLNFTIPEINLEEKNSFLSPEPLSELYETVILKNEIDIPSEKSSPKILIKPADNKLAMKSKTVEKDQLHRTPVNSQSKLQPMRYFSERRIYNQNETEVKKACAKKLPLQEKRPTTAEKIKGGKMCEPNTTPPSKIPVLGMKNSKIPVNERVTRPLTTTIAKTPGKSSKNSKFNHIESPINAYIHNKPTSLVCNVKPEVKKDSMTKVWKAQTIGSANKIQEKAHTQYTSSAVLLPFVEYKSATPYKIEKRPESRLPRLAPNVIKLIGYHSPKVLKHEGRFYRNKPKKQSSTETTVVADPNEVSVVLSRPVQKSNTIK